MRWSPETWNGGGLNRHIERQLQSSLRHVVVFGGPRCTPGGNDHGPILVRELALLASLIRSLCSVWKSASGPKEKEKEKEERKKNIHKNERKKFICN